MTTNSEQKPDAKPRILLYSERNLYEREVWRCPFYEFEHILQDIDSVDLLAPKRTRWYKDRLRASLKLGNYLSAPLVSPGIAPIKLDKDYDVFFTVIEKPGEALNIKAIQGLKDHCKTSICWVSEFYVWNMKTHRSSLEMLKEFDHVIFMASRYEPFKDVLPGEVTYMAAGVDALRFCPYPNPPERCIDVLSIGRRSEKTHQALLKLAREEGLFYMYDTIDDLRAYSLEEHRALVQNMAKRSRYFIVNPGKVDMPEETGGQAEFGYRYFEAAAPGTIMIGERCKNKEFEKIFTWEDCVIKVPFGSEDIGDIIKDLDRQPERQAKIRRRNIVQSLSHHDWAYRWESVLKTAGLEPLPGLIKRKQELAALAALVQADQTQPQYSGRQ
ncbi:MAG: glycosyltransferase [Terriglobales bacterium]|jgi:hypothetical protein